MTDRNGRGRDCRVERATSAVVGVALLVGLTLLLSAAGAAVVGFGEAALSEPVPSARVEATLSATDGWPDGQRLRLTHEAGETLAVEDLAVVVELPAAGVRARATDLPTRRLAGDSVRGAALFDRTYAGVDGEFDAVHTDGRWESGEAAEVRIAQRAVDVEAGDRAIVLVVHRRTGGVVARAEPIAS